MQNPTIEFPDYTLGVIYEHGVNNNFVLRGAVASSHGLADNPAVTYAQLVDVNGSDKGLFLSASATWKYNQRLWRIGAWNSSAPHDNLAGTESGLDNDGGYLLAGGITGRESALRRGERRRIARRPDWRRDVSISPAAVRCWRRCGADISFRTRTVRDAGRYGTI